MPNVLLVMTDSHSPFVSSVYGHPFVITPNMERLARMGTVYENAYCASPLCVPARSAFMTGRYVHEIEVFNNCHAIDAEYPTYGGVLREQGVHTAYIGGGTRLFCDEDKFGFAEMLLTIPRKLSLNTNFVRSNLDPPPGPPKLEYGVREDAWAVDEARVDCAVQWLTERAPQLTTDWTLTVGLFAPHRPLYARREYWELYESHKSLPDLGPDEESAQHPYARDLRRWQRADRFTEADVLGLRQGYYAAVTFVDHQLGRLLDALESTGRLDDTVVIFTSDHGEMLGKFGLWWKCTLFEDSVRIPLIVAGPGFARGARVETPVGQLDIQATLFRAVGRDRPAGWHGEPLQDIPAADPDRVVFSEYHGPGVRSGAFMVRRGRWKLMYNMAAPLQLYDLVGDPDERVNLYARMPDVAGELERELRRICDPEDVNARAHARERKQYEIIMALAGRP